MSEQICWINIGPEGRFRRSGQISTSPADVDRLLGAGLAGRQRLVLHFHGGLVDESSGRKIAEAMAAVYGDSAASIGLVWETGILEVFRDNLNKLHDRRAFRKALSWIIAKAAPALGAAEGARGATGGSLDPKAIERMLESEEGVALLDAALSADDVAGGAETMARGGAGEEGLLVETIAFELELGLGSDPELVTLVETGAEGAGPIRKKLELDDSQRGASLAALALLLAKVVIAVIGRYRKGTHHDLLPTCVEELLRAAFLGEIGVSAWSDMKRKALEMWTDDGADPGEEGHVGGYMLRRLEALQAARPDVTIDLVGHSAGSIGICHMLAAIEAQGRAIKIRNIAFLAPAVRLDMFAARIVRRQPQFARFRTFTMTDPSEKLDRMVGALYPRSLLFFISGLLEEEAGVPLAGLARHVTAPTASAGPDYDDVRRWLADGDRLVLAPTADDAPEGLRTRSHMHGYFDDDGPTRESLVFLARMTP